MEIDLDGLRSFLVSRRSNKTCSGCSLHTCIHKSDCHTLGWELLWFLIACVIHFWLRSTASKTFESQNTAVPNSTHVRCDHSQNLFRKFHRKLFPPTYACFYECLCPLFLLPLLSKVLWFSKTQILSFPWGHYTFKFQALTQLKQWSHRFILVLKMRTNFVEYGNYYALSKHLQHFHLPLGHITGSRNWKVDYYTLFT